MRIARLAWLASLALLGCGQAREPDTDARPYAPPSPEPAQTVQVRNACPEAVVIAISASEPGPATPTMTLLSTKVAELTVEDGARIWLRFDGHYNQELSIVPSDSVEIGFQCNSIYSREENR
jgi:hypothetical protein